MADKGAESERKTLSTRPALDELARTLHASFLDRWGRHDPAGLEEALAGKHQEAPSRRTSVA